MYNGSGLYRSGSSERICIRYHMFWSTGIKKNGPFSLPFLLNLHSAGWVSCARSAGTSLSCILDLPQILSVQKKCWVYLALHSSFTVLFSGLLIWSTLTHRTIKYQLSELIASIKEAFFLLPCLFVPGGRILSCSLYFEGFSRSLRLSWPNGPCTHDLFLVLL